MANQRALPDRFRLGLRVLIALLVLTAAELPVAFRVPHPVPYLILINLADAWLILYYFMHLGQTWQPEE
ncbi:MAG: cytochrome C oxidase subunit IV family protein [Armatimonadota bacterium]|nr:cytochrome C oxidase subunit IV family protein [Armatimonadota bacterium]MDR7451516.1 cytochrome C oxidase subunit IV family protein [Armatimonadota bacterium]MDR7467483.1 cytochrome C oxidase subunit IV family protein [Armatimonadota bacterium]MDR7494357.1 cytochrome C oxidase subunit IV family protein [Armatimonadota bacterium]MDR7499174.1 cytochrome C oxidase subunit IV family protein [Armatimonadota bacterium]